jgi:hypothetical protein
MHPLQKIITLFLAITIILILSGPTSGASAQEAVCGAGPVPASLIQQVTQGRWAGWIAQLSGAMPARLDGQPVTISSRFTPAMFLSGAPAHSAAFDFVLQQVRQWYPESQITTQDFPAVGQSYTARNLILEVPGTLRPDEIVVLSAHLDSTSIQAYTNAPGAEDNASGSAALLEAARLLSRYRFERTLQIVWFTGEEQGLVGSSYYAHHLPAGRTIIGDINLDMYGYDADNDHCFELHVGNAPASEAIGSCFAATIQANNLNLTYDYLDQETAGSSDHVSFWNVNLGAIEILENHFNQNKPDGCVGADANPYYHQITDTIDHINLPSGTEITRAALATAANLAGPVGICFDGASPSATAARSANAIAVGWSDVAEANTYRIWRSDQGCSAGWAPVAEVGGSNLGWLDTLGRPGSAYQVEAIAQDGCVSLPSPCAPASGFLQTYLPVAAR